MKNILAASIIASAMCAPVMAAELIVNWENPNDVHSVEALKEVSAVSGMTVEKVKDLQFTFDLVRIDGVDADVAIDALKNTGFFKYVEVNGQVRVPRNDLGTVISVQKPTINKNGMSHTMSFVVDKFNDPLYLQQQYLDDQEESRMGLSSILKARDYAVSHKVYADKVRVAVLDTGKWLHEDMNWSSDEASFIEGSGNQYCLSADMSNSGGDITCPAEDLVNSYPSNDAMDKTWYNGNIAVHGHGLAVASHIAAISDNAKGMIGVVPNNSVEIVPVRVLAGNGGGGTFGIANGMLWAMGLYENTVSQGERGWVNPISKPVDIMNLSLGGASQMSCEVNGYMRTAIEEAYKRNIHVVIAAGNESSDTTYVTPSNCEEAFVVASSKMGGEISDFSNYGDYVDIAMHGEEITGGEISTSLYTNGVGCGEGDKEVATCYSNHTGTSMSAPLTSGVLALIKMVHPELSAKEREAMLLNTAVPYNVDVVGRTTQAAKLGYGAGVIHAFNAIKNDALEIGNIQVQHSFEGYTSPVQELYVSTMMKAVPNACSKYKVQFGTLQHEVDGITFNVVQSNSQGETISKVVKVPNTIVDRSMYDQVTVQACKDGQCGEVVALDFSKASAPSACNI